MNLKEQVQSDIKEAMKSKDALKTSCLRMVMADIKNLSIAKQKDLYYTLISLCPSCHSSSEQEMFMSYQIQGKVRQIKTVRLSGHRLDLSS